MAFANKFGKLAKYASLRCMASSKVFVGGLSYRTNSQSLRDAFSSCGKVIGAKVIVDRETGRSRRFGFVNFAYEDEATNAIREMDGKEIDGRTVNVEYAEEKRYPLYEDKYLDIHYNSRIHYPDFVLEVCGEPHGISEQWLEHMFFDAAQ